MANKRFLTAAGIAAALALATGCSVHNQETPSLAGPSGLGTTLTITVSPDVLTRDGASQSVVTVTATGPTGQPVSNLSMRLAVLDQLGQVTGALGTLSALNVVTNGNGQATAVFTAPASIPGVATATLVEIGATPAGTDFGNSAVRVAQLELVPQGVIGAPPSALTPNFTAPAPNVGDSALFSATVVDSKGNNATNQVASFSWNFGDGGTASGQNVTHTFTSLGNFPVTLTITDLQGDTAFVTHAVTVGQGTLPTAAFVITPAQTAKTPVTGEVINFNASGSTAAPGHTITTFSWNFGDGTLGDGALTTHSYSAAGTYVITLKVTDDVGRKSALVSQTLQVFPPRPTAQITAPGSGVIGQLLTFSGNQSFASPGRTIVSYAWDFGDGGTATGETAKHAFGAAKTYTVTLVVTDDQGNQDITTALVTISS